jgi:secreted pullulanase
MIDICRRARHLARAALLLLAACSSGKSVHYPTPPAAAPLGVSYDSGTKEATFRVWAPAAGAAGVSFYPAWDSTAQSAGYPMARDLTGGGDVDKDGWNGVWTATVPGVASGQLYQYSLDGRPALDPYAPSMARFDSSSQTVGKGAVLDPAAIPPADPATGADAAWVPFAAPPGYSRREDAVIYEVHVRDFTIRDASGTYPPGTPLGTYGAFVARLDHLQALGVTHVQLLPVLAYYYGDEGKRATVELAPTTGPNNYNWGYDPHSWFAPSGMYSADPADPILRVRELETLVNEAHRRGLGVILDVVYNHTGNTRILDALAPGYYYRGSNVSGVGNDTASERKMMRKLVVDSVRYLTAQYHLDGFRFDLMSLLDSETMLQAYAAASAVNPMVLFLGEGWRLGGVPPRDYAGSPIVAADQNWMGNPESADHFAVFSDSFRDIMKGGGFGEGDSANVGFLTSQSPFGSRVIDKSLLLRNIRGDATNFSASSPGDCVQYLTAHDGLTLHDKIAKVLGLNPDTQGAEIMKVARLGFVLQSTSQGIDFIHGGCEMGRTKRVPTAQHDATPGSPGGVYFVYNSYDSSDAVNAYDWGLMAPGSEGERSYRYLQGLLALRRSSDAFRLAVGALAASRVTALDASQPYAIAYRVADSAGATSHYVFVNVGGSAVSLATGDDLTAATCVVDDDEAGAGPVAAPSGFSALTASSITLAPRTAVVFRK